MGEIKMCTTKQTGGRNQRPKLIDPKMSNIVSEFPQRLQNFLKSQMRGVLKLQDGKDVPRQTVRNKRKSSADWQAELQKQMQLWRENPIWGGQPAEIDVTVPKGSLCNLHVTVDVGLPPDAIYNIVIDPNNKRVFRNIKEVNSRKVLVDEGSRQVVELEQAAIWKFLWLSGKISVHVLVDQNRDDHLVKFKQVGAGIMKKFEGCWRVEPLFVDEKVCYPFKPKTLFDYRSCTGGKGRIGSRVSLVQLLQPAIVPPPPISWYFQGIISKTAQTLIDYLVEEVARIKGVTEATESYSDVKSADPVFSEVAIDQIRDIKQRWTLHRKNALHCRKR